MTRAAGILITFALGAASLAFAQSTPTVYVTTSKSKSLSSQKQRDLADSARDVREQLRKRDGVEAAEDRDDADVLITILDRRIEVNETGTNDWGGALSQTHYQSRYIVFFRFESQSAIEESEIASPRQARCGARHDPGLAL